MVRLALTLFLLFLAACSPQADQRLKPAGQGGGSGKDSNDGVLTAPEVNDLGRMEGAIKIEWSDSSEYDSYLIYFSNFSGVNEASETIEATVSPFIHTGLDPAKTYYYRVGGVKKGKYGPLSRELSAQPFIPGQATSNVGRPKLVNTTRSSATAINVSWASVPGAESYLVFYSMSPGVSRTSSSLTTASESVLHSNLLTGVIYYYRVAAVKGGLPGELSFEVSGVATSEVIDSGGAPPPQPPPAPMDFMVTTGINRSLQLDWTSVSGAEAYNIYFDTFPAINSSSSKISITTKPYLHTGLDPGVTYYYKVAAVRSGVIGALSSIQSGIPKLDSTVVSNPLPKPSFTSQPIPGISSMSLAWSSVSGAYRYYLFFSNLDNVTSSSNFIILSGTAYNHLNLDPDKTYYYRVAAVRRVSGTNALEVGELSDGVNAIPIKPTAVSPTISLESGIYATEKSISVGLSTPTSGSFIKYRIDGSMPTCDTSSLNKIYTIPVVLTSTTELKAITCRSGYFDSNVSEASYIINLPNCGGTTDFNSNNSCYSDTTLSWKYALITGTKTVLQKVPADPSCSGASCFMIWKEYLGNRFLNATGIWVLNSSEWQKKLNRTGLDFDQFAAYPVDSERLVGRACPSDSFISEAVQHVSNQCLYYDLGTTVSLSAAAGVEGIDFLTSWDSNKTISGNVAAWFEGNIKVCADRGMRLPTIFETTASKPTDNLPSHSNPSFTGDRVPSLSGFTWTASPSVNDAQKFWAWSGDTSADFNSNQNNFVRCVLPSESILFCGQKGNSCYDNNWLKSRRSALVGSGIEIEYVQSAGGAAIWQEKNGSSILKASGFWNGPDDWQKQLALDGLSFTAADFTRAEEIVGRSCPKQLFFNRQNMTVEGSCAYYDALGSPAYLNADKASGLLGVNYLESWNDVASGGGSVGSWYEGNIKLCADKNMRLPTLYETDVTAPITGLPKDATPVFAGSTGIPSPLLMWTASANLDAIRSFFTANYSTASTANSIPPAVGVAPTVRVRCVLPASEPIFKIISHPTSVVYYDGTANLSVNVETSPSVSISYQWEKSTDNGATYQKIMGQTTNSLNLMGLTINEHKQRYRVVVSGDSDAMPRAVKISNAAAIFSRNRLSVCGASMSSSCYSSNAALSEGLALLPDEVSLIELVQTNSRFKVWKDYFSDKIIPASGVWDGTDGWQRRLLRSGESKSQGFFVDWVTLEGRVCPTNVFVERTRPAELNRCLYYDSGSIDSQTGLPKTQSLKNSRIGTEGQDFVDEWTSEDSGSDSSASWYEGNVKFCADKGMRLPTLFETNATFAPNFSPIEAAVSFSGVGVPNLGGLTWTASGQLEDSKYFIVWNGASSVQINFSDTTGIAVRCVLPH